MAVNDNRWQWMAITGLTYVGKDELNGMAIDGSDADRSRPLVMSFVEMLVKPRMMQQTNNRSTKKKTVRYVRTENDMEK